MSNLLRDSAFSSDKEPLWQDFENFIGNNLWTKFNVYIKEAYKIQPNVNYSVCSAQRGWNVKYKKGGKALCTLYPEKGYFIALIVIGEKEEFAVNAMLPAFTQYTQNLYANTAAMKKMGRWLMVNVTDENILKDVIALINIKAEP